MPYLQINTNVKLDLEQEQALLGLCSSQVASMLGKPERYVMASIESGLSMIFAGSDSPCAYLELKSLGLAEEKSADYSQSLCALISDALKIPTERIYIEFSNPARHLWGWDGATF